MEEKLQTFYGNLFEKKLIQEIAEVGIYKQVPKGTRLIEIGSLIKSIPLLLTGAVKILREDENGNELLLYFLEKGDTCAMTLTCCMGNTRSQIRAIAELDTELIFVPSQKMEDWLKYKTWRDFVFESYNTRLYEMLDAIDTLAFLNMNERLYKYLKNKVLIKKSKELPISHQEIAYELNTSRVVISRLLKQLENEGKVKLYRNKLEVLEF
ncbi:Crp/Fnr family transcriptional regulator [Flexithrix dorotheae]|uniref:Crp/Fnr family transcriptional regulator n=1 Tax=Flexithrix dorotheae TaxID=70993 RepID=UPI0003619552|nr:Crp/Fnr family transcriptional regulator [Flexithrix dorotheae]